jgi:hypothetical protein
MMSTLRTAVRPLIFVVLITLGSAGAVFADGSYGGTDPPKRASGPVQVQSDPDDSSTGLPSVWTQLSLTLVRWVAALE